MTIKKRIVFFTKYTADAPVTGCHFYIQKRLLEENGFVCSYHSFYSSSASKRLSKKGKEGNAVSLFFAALKRLLQLLFLKANDVAVIEYPLLPGASYRLQKWLLRKQKFIVTDLFSVSLENARRDDKLKPFLSFSHTIVTANSILTKYVLPLAHNVAEISPCIQVEDYAAVKPVMISEEERKMFRIGWIGTETTSQHLLMIKDCLFQLHDLYHIQLMLIGFDKKYEKELQGLPYSIYTRATNTELSLLKTCTAGILPLPDVSSVDVYSTAPMLQYMACGLPVVASSNEVTIAFSHGNDNLFARTPFEWYSCLAAMIQNKDYYKETGENNRRTAEEFYSAEKTAKDYLSLLVSITD